MISLQIKIAQLDDGQAHLTLTPTVEGDTPTEWNLLSQLANVDGKKDDIHRALADILESRGGTGTE
jgi:hypothetical protein